MEYRKILLPDNLSPEATRYIKKVIDALKSNDNLNTVDEGAIFILASSYNQYIEATSRVNNEGLTVVGRGDTLVAHPCVRIAKDNKSVCLSIMQQFGLTLKARKKLDSVDTNEPDSPLSEFMKILS